MSVNNDLEAMYHAAIEAVKGRSAVRRWLEDHPLSGEWHVLALGKAGCSMAHGAMDVLGDRVTSGLVVTREGYLDEAITADARFRVVESAHPVPDGRSLEAGRAAVDFLREAPANARFLLLVSGGTSALLELLADEAGAEQLAELNRRLLASGLDIIAMNRIRKRFSRVKGGRLARWLDGREARQLVISDVQGDDPVAIGSGPLVPDPDPDRSPLQAEFRDLCAEAEAPPSPDDPCFSALETHLVATNRHARHAAAEEAQRRGYAVTVHDDVFLEGDAVALGRELARTVIDGAPGVHVWGGEPTVVLPREPGEGGRMQALTLAAATELAGHSGCWLLGGGTDGADGPTEAAGAVVDGGTVERGTAYGAPAATALECADAGRYLAASGDLLHTGPTGTNVMDVVIGLHQGSDER
ncbi:glycerate kinase type-2 family protein [Arhodomonas sp. AD133]|uniref:glycerate kinase type-2 family protein n=1 Tax=Arhodomonas sp. AD133 TaxID=3415009 RepID=UPI003EBDED20